MFILDLCICFCSKWHHLGSVTSSGRLPILSVWWHSYWTFNSRLVWPTAIYPEWSNNMILLFYCCVWPIFIIHVWHFKPILNTIMEIMKKWEIILYAISLMLNFFPYYFHILKINSSVMSKNKTSRYDRRGLKSCWNIHVIKQ